MPAQSKRSRLLRAISGRSPAKDVAAPSNHLGLSPADGSTPVRRSVEQPRSSQTGGLGGPGQSPSVRCDAWLDGPTAVMCSPILRVESPDALVHPNQSVVPYHAAGRTVMKPETGQYAPTEPV